MKRLRCSSQVLWVVIRRQVSPTCPWFRGWFAVDLTSACRYWTDEGLCFGWQMIYRVHCSWITNKTLGQHERRNWSHALIPSCPRPLSLNQPQIIIRIRGPEPLERGRPQVLNSNLKEGSKSLDTGTLIGWGQLWLGINNQIKRPCKHIGFTKILQGWPGTKRLPACPSVRLPAPVFSEWTIRASGSPSSRRSWRHHEYHRT